MPGEGEEASTLAPKEKPTAATPAPAPTSTKSSRISDGGDTKSSNEKTAEIFPPPPFEGDVPVNNQPVDRKDPPTPRPFVTSGTSAPVQPAPATPKVPSSRNAAPVVKPEATQPKVESPARVQPPSPPAVAPPGAIVGARATPAPAILPTQARTPAPSAVVGTVPPPDAKQGAVPTISTTVATSTIKEGDDDYHPEPDVFPFTVPADELIGRTPEVPAPATIETPKPPPQPFDPSSACTYGWIEWSYVAVLDTRFYFQFSRPCGRLGQHGARARTT